MSLEGQRPDPARYTVIPRTLVFLLRGEEVLLLRLGEGKGAWAGRYNGLGGHVERGEDPLSAARREVREETGLIPRGLRLCGVVHVDTGSSPGIGLYVFVGEAEDGSLEGSDEGRPEWVPLDRLDSVPLVEDLTVILPRAVAVHRDGAAPFSALYTFDEAGQVQIRIN